MLRQVDVSYFIELVDMVLKYTKYHEYHFLNKEILLFNAPAVQIWSLQKKNQWNEKTNEIYLKKFKYLQI
jgi:hypothetical protein